jgi:hypothetical protein
MNKRVGFYRMAKKAVPFVRQVFVFVLTAAIVFALLKWYKDQSEGFQSCPANPPAAPLHSLMAPASPRSVAVLRITGKGNGSTYSNLAVSIPTNSTIDPAILSSIRVSPSSSNGIQITGLPESLGKLDDVKIHSAPTSTTSTPRTFTPVLTTRIGMNGTVIKMEGGSGGFVPGAVRVDPTDTTTPQLARNPSMTISRSGTRFPVGSVKDFLKGTIRIYNLDISNLQPGLDQCRSPNLYIDLRFVPL